MVSRTQVFALSTVALLGASSTARAGWPSLDEALKLSRERSVSVVSARGQQNVANAGLDGARASFIGNPYLDLQIDRGSTTKDVQAMGYLYLPVDVFGQRGARIDEANALIRWKGTSVRDAQAMVTAETAYAYGSVLVASERMTLAQRGEQAAKSEVDYFASRLSVQDATVYEKSLAETELGRWNQAHAEAKYALSGALLRLSELTLASDLSAPSASPAVLIPPRLRGAWDDAFIARSVTQAPSILSQQSEENYWEMAKQRWEAERRTPLSLLLIGGRGDPGDVRLGGGLAITFPFTRRNQGEIARAEAEKLRVHDARVAQASTLVLRLKSTAQAYRDLTEALAQLDAKAIPAAQRALDAAQESYKRGKIDLVHAFLARRELATMESRKLELVLVAWRAYAELTLATGDLP